MCVAGGLEDSTVHLERPFEPVPQWWEQGLRPPASRLGDLVEQLLDFLRIFTGADATADSRADDLKEAILEANGGERVDVVLHMSGTGFDAELDKPIRAPFIVWEPEYVDITTNEAMQAASENKSPGERDNAKNLLLALRGGRDERLLLSYLSRSYLCPTLPLPPSLT